MQKVNFSSFIYRNNINDNLGIKIVSNDNVGQWVANILGFIYNKKDSIAIGLKKNGEIVAGFVYNNYISNRCVNMHVVGNFFTKTFIKFAFNHAYDTLKVVKTIAYIDSTNIKSIEFTKKLGAIREAKIKSGAKHGDLLIYSMTKEQFRFKDK